MEWRPLTEKEIANFRIPLPGAKFYPTYEEFVEATDDLPRTEKIWQSFCDRDNNIFWTKVLDG